MAIAYDGQLNCGLTVRDLDRSIDWYGRVLGFQLTNRIDAIGLAILSTPVGGVVLGLTEGEPGGAPTALTWGVEDIEQARAALQAAGVDLDGPIEAIPGVVQLQGFFDPDGNRLTFWAPPA